jgi:hypothetical protein
MKTGCLASSTMVEQRNARVNESVQGRHPAPGGLPAIQPNMAHQENLKPPNVYRYSAGNRQCDPSQKGGLAVCLQAHQAMVFSSLTSTFTGANPLS